MYMIFSLYWISYKKTSIASTTSGYTRASGQQTLLVEKQILRTDRRVPRVENEYYK